MGVGVQGASGQAVGVGVQDEPSGRRHGTGVGVCVGGGTVGVLVGGQRITLPSESLQVLACAICGVIAEMNKAKMIPKKTTNRILFGFIFCSSVI